MSYLTRIRRKFLAPSRWVHAPLNAIAAFVAMLIGMTLMRQGPVPRWIGDIVDPLYFENPTL